MQERKQVKRGNLEISQIWLRGERKSPPLSHSRGEADLKPGETQKETYTFMCFVLRVFVSLGLTS